MSVIRVEKTKDYTVMSNYHLKEKKMSLKAKGLLSLMLSLPDDWNYSIAGLVAICKENETAIKSTLKELQEFGYVIVEKIMPDKTESGRIEYVYNIFEKPKQEDKKQGVENLPLEIQCVENQVQLNTKEQNTNKVNTKEKKKIIKKDFSDMILKICLENDIEDDKSIELIEQFLTEMKIKTKGAMEANIAKVAGKTFETINKCIQTSYERNYKYITPPEWLQNNSYNGNGKCSKDLAWRTHEEMAEAEKKRQEFIEMVKNNDPSLHKF
nr:MAG TPA: Dna polymerase B [Caudoviricetes sp.]